MTPPALSARGLVRRFGARTAVDGIDVRIDSGQVVALLGPNGAGKTTTVRMCATLLAPTAGTVQVAGVDAVRSPRAARARLGLVLGGDGGFYGRASARDNLLFFADVGRVRGAERAAMVEDALERVSLTDRAADRVADFSRGMKQRLHIARALLARPSLLLLDEPSTGLDPQAARELRELIRAVAEAGTGVLLTTHYLAEAEALSNQIVVIDSGRVVVRGTAADIAAAAGVRTVSLVSLDAISESVIAMLQRIPGVRAVHTEPDGVGVRVRVAWHETANTDAVQRVTQTAGSEARHVYSRPATLEEAYVALIDARRATSSSGSAA